MSSNWGRGGRNGGQKKKITSSILYSDLLTSFRKLVPNKFQVNEGNPMQDRSGGGEQGDVPVMKKLDGNERAWGKLESKVSAKQKVEREISEQEDSFEWRNPLSPAKRDANEVARAVWRKSESEVSSSSRTEGKRSEEEDWAEWKKPLFPATKTWNKVVSQGQTGMVLTMSGQFSVTEGGETVFKQGEMKRKQSADEKKGVKKDKKPKKKDRKGKKQRKSEGKDGRADERNQRKERGEEQKAKKGDRKKKDKKRFHDKGFEKNSENPEKGINLERKLNEAATSEVVPESESKILANTAFQCNPVDQSSLKKKSKKPKRSRSRNDSEKSMPNLFSPDSTSQKVPEHVQLRLGTAPNDLTHGKKRKSLKAKKRSTDEHFTRDKGNKVEKTKEKIEVGHLFQTTRETLSFPSAPKQFFCTPGQSHFKTESETSVSPVRLPQKIKVATEFILNEPSAKKRKSKNKKKSRSEASDQMMHFEQDSVLQTGPAGSSSKSTSKKRVHKQMPKSSEENNGCKKDRSSQRIAKSSDTMSLKRKYANVSQEDCFQAPISEPSYLFATKVSPIHISITPTEGERSQKRNPKACTLQEEPPYKKRPNDKNKTLAFQLFGSDSDSDCALPKSRTHGRKSKSLKRRRSSDDKHPQHGKDKLYSKSSSEASQHFFNNSEMLTKSKMHTGELPDKRAKRDKSCSSKTVSSSTVSRSEQRHREYSPKPSLFREKSRSPDYSHVYDYFFGRPDSASPPRPPTPTFTLPPSTSRNQCEVEDNAAESRWDREALNLSESDSESDISLDSNATCGAISISNTNSNSNANPNSNSDSDSDTESNSDSSSGSNSDSGTPAAITTTLSSEFGNVTLFNCINTGRPSKRNKHGDSTGVDDHPRQFEMNQMEISTARPPPNNMSHLFEATLRGNLPENRIIPTTSANNLSVASSINPVDDNTIRHSERWRYQHAKISPTDFPDTKGLITTLQHDRKETEMARAQHLSNTGYDQGEQRHSRERESLKNLNSPPKPQQHSDGMEEALEEWWKSIEGLTGNQNFCGKEEDKLKSKTALTQKADGDKYQKVGKTSQEGKLADKFIQPIPRNFYPNESRSQNKYVTTDLPSQSVSRADAAALDSWCRKVNTLGANDFLKGSRIETSSERISNSFVDDNRNQNFSTDLLTLINLESKRPESGREMKISIPITKIEHTSDHSTQRRPVYYTTAQSEERIVASTVPNLDQNQKRKKFLENYNRNLAYASISTPTLARRPFECQTLAQQKLEEEAYDPTRRKRGRWSYQHARINRSTPSNNTQPTTLSLASHEKRPSSVVASSETAAEFEATKTGSEGTRKLPTISTEKPYLDMPDIFGEANVRPLCQQPGARRRVSHFNSTSTFINNTHLIPEYKIIQSQMRKEPDTVPIITLKKATVKEMPIQHDAPKSSGHKHPVKKRSSPEFASKVATFTSQQSRPRPRVKRPDPIDWPPSHLIGKLPSTISGTAAATSHSRSLDYKTAMLKSSVPPTPQLRQVNPREKDEETNKKRKRKS